MEAYNCSTDNSLIVCYNLFGRCIAHRREPLGTHRVAWIARDISRKKNDRNPFIEMPNSYWEF